MKILTEPNEALHKNAKPVLDITTGIIRKAKGMLKLMRRQQGIGLAAPQVGWFKRVVVVEIPKEVEQNSPSPKGPYFLINPIIKKKSSKKTKAWEGCLSLPGLEVEVERADKIKMVYRDLNNVQHTLATGGLLSRAIQHEIDHLNGVLITNYGKPQKIKKY